MGSWFFASGVSSGIGLEFVREFLQCDTDSAVFAVGFVNHDTTLFCCLNECLAELLGVNINDGPHVGSSVFVGAVNAGDTVNSFLKRELVGACDFRFGAIVGGLGCVCHRPSTYTSITPFLLIVFCGTIGTIVFQWVVLSVLFYRLGTYNRV
jgi:hypothetical protein